MLSLVLEIILLVPLGLPLMFSLGSCVKVGRLFSACTPWFIHGCTLVLPGDLCLSIVPCLLGLTLGFDTLVSLTSLYVLVFICLLEFTR